MKKCKILLAIILIIGCIVNNYNVAQAVNFAEDIIGQVEKYTSIFNEDDINICIENGEYQKAQNLIQEAKNGYKERWGYKGLVTNDIYIAYQFKEYMTEDFLSKGWRAKVTTWFSGLFYNDELKEYLAMQSPGVNKYKDMLINFMQETKDNLICKEYIEELKYSIESISDTVEIFDNIEELYDMFSQAGSKADVDKAVLNFIKANPSFFANENMTYLFKNNLSKLESQISKSLTFLGAGLEYIDTTISGIAEIDFFVANMEVLTYYEDFLKNIQYAKNDSGNYVAPDDLRIAASELRLELEGNFSNSIANIINEYGLTTALTGVELLDLLGEGMFAQIILGIGISSMFGNAYLDMSSLVKGVAYVQGYAYLGEIYSTILEKDKEVFLKEKSEENAKQFRKDYEMLWNIRLNGESSYREMCDFSETWNEDAKNILKLWTDYASKEKFCSNNIEMIKKFQFIEPEIIAIRQNETENLEEYNQVIELYSNWKSKDYADLEKENLNPLISDEGIERLYYALYDLNCDNIPELIIACDDTKGIIDIRTFYNNNVIRLFDDQYGLGMRNSCTIGEDNCVYIFEPCGANKAYEYIYEIDVNQDNCLTEIKFYELIVDNEGNIKYYDLTGNNNVEIAREQYESRVINNYNNGSKFEWQPIE